MIKTSNEIKQFAPRAVDAMLKVDRASEPGLLESSVFARFLGALAVFVVNLSLPPIGLPMECDSVLPLYRASKTATSR